MKWFILFCASLPVVGCAVVEPLPVETRSDVQKRLRLLNAPLPLRVKVLSSHNSSNSSLDPNRIVEALELLFASVKAVSSKDDGTRFHLVIRMKLGDMAARYIGRTKWRVPKIMVWMLSEFLSALIADEKYEVTSDVEVELVSPHHGNTVLLHKHQKVRTEVVLNDWQRGFKFWGIWFVPKHLKKKNIHRVKKHAIPRLEEDVKAFLLNTLAEFFIKKGLTDKDRLYAWLSIHEKKPPKPKPVRFLMLGLVRYKGRYSAEYLFNAAASVFGYPDLRRVIFPSSIKQIHRLLDDLKKRTVKHAIVYVNLPTDGRGNLKLYDGSMPLSEIVSAFKDAGTTDCFIIFDGVLSEKSVPKLGKFLLVASCLPGEKVTFSGRLTNLSELLGNYLLRDRIKRLSSSSLREMVDLWLSRQMRIRRVRQTVRVYGGSFGIGER